MGLLPATRLRASKPIFFTDEWTHECFALVQDVTLWVERCPHCGMPCHEQLRIEREEQQRIDKFMKKDQT